MVVTNPLYVPRVKRGIFAIRWFKPGLPIIAHETDKNYFNLVSRSIDIPALGLVGINDPNLVRTLLASSEVATFRSSVKVSANETLLACSKCSGTQWYNVHRKADKIPLRWVCATCHREVRVIQLTHQSGHAD